MQAYIWDQFYFLTVSYRPLTIVTVKIMGGLLAIFRANFDKLPHKMKWLNTQLTHIRIAKKEKAMAAWMVSVSPPSESFIKSFSAELTSPHSAAMYTKVMNHNKAYAPNAAASIISKILRSYKRRTHDKTDKVQSFIQHLNSNNWTQTFTMRVNYHKVQLWQYTKRGVSKTWNTE